MSELVSQVYVYGPRDRVPTYVNLINTTSRSSVDWSRELSPFHLGPVNLYEEHVAQNVENAWQYSKLYKEHTDGKGDPTKRYWEWAESGWGQKRAVRYPMGKGSVPLYSLWDGKKLSYVDARKQIYIPLYSSAVRVTKAYKWLVSMYGKGQEIHLWDFDGYNRGDQTITQVVNNPHKKMGHAFVLAMMLQGEIENVNVSE